MAEQLLSRLTSVVESFFPLVPYVGPGEKTEWQEPEVYYFTDDPSLRLRQRWIAILKLDRNLVSFWRRRTAYVRDPLRGWDCV